MPLSDEVDQGSSSDPTTQWDRRWFVLSLVAAGAPVLFAAIRDGMSGWKPTYDTALTITRVRDMFSAHPPLVGMAALNIAWIVKALAALTDTPRAEWKSLVQENAFVYPVSVGKVVVEHRKSLGAAGPLPRNLNVFVNGELGAEDLFRWFDLRLAEREEQLVVTMS